MRLFSFLAPNRTDFRLPVLFGNALFWSVVGLLVGLAVFPSAGIPVALFLFVLPQAATLRALLRRNREEVYAPDGDRIKANRDLAWAVLTIFLAVLSAYVIAIQAKPESGTKAWFAPLLGYYSARGIETVNFGTFRQLIEHNAWVFVVAFMIALLYREGGLLLVLGWNASRWGAIFSHMALVAGAERAIPVPVYLAKTAACVLPHLVLEALAYVLAAMSGLFLSKGLSQYPLRSAIFVDVLVFGVIRVGLAGFIILLGAALVEARLPSALIQRLFAP